MKVIDTVLEQQADWIAKKLLREGKNSYRLPDMSTKSIALARLLTEKGICAEVPTRQEMMQGPNERNRRR